MLKLILSHQCPGQHNVQLLRDGKLFAVIYGHEQHLGLSYEAAAAQFGFCVMHAASCAGLIKS